LVAGGVALAAALVVLVFALTAGSDAKPPYRTPSLAVAKQKLAIRLHDRLLRPHWIACVATGRHYQGAGVVRCNVNFGDPHIQAYCTLLQGGKLVTQYDDGAIPCSHDDAGWSSPVQNFN
jgi:hypothetical protein